MGWWCVSPSEALDHGSGREAAHAEQHEQQEQEARCASQSPVPPVWSALPSQQRRGQPGVLALCQRVKMFQVDDDDLLTLYVGCVLLALLAGVDASSLQNLFHEVALLTSSGHRFTCRNPCRPQAAASGGCCRGCLHRTSMHENQPISLRKTTKRSEDTIRRFL